MAYWHLSEVNNITYCAIDLKDEKVNKLSADVLKEFSEVLKQLAFNNNTNVLVIHSLKPGMFIAGADISEIQDITEPKDALEKVSMGQEILNQLADLPFPTVAAINGACLGGGCELALACDFRVISDHPKTQIGLPEVNLGIIPGFGGTQRLPRLIGLQKALPMILGGKAVDGKKAARAKLADLIAPAAFFEKRVQDFAESLMNPNVAQDIKDKRKLKGFINVLLEKTPFGRATIYAMAKKNLVKKTKGHYPAPFKALEAVKRGLRTSLKRGLQIEAECFSYCAPTQISKNLIGLFYTTEKLKKYTGVSSPDPEIKPIKKGGVLGAGLMGGGIAWLLSYREIPVMMKDISWQAITMGYEAAQKILKQLLRIRRIKPNDMNLAMHRIQGSLDYKGFQDVDVVIEAVVENMDLKKKVFNELEGIVRCDTILATNTSALSVTEMAKDLTTPDRFIGMHFFSPVNRMPLVEIIPGEKTSDDTIATIVALTKKLKKTPIVVQNCPGFLVNRILIPYVNEAVLCLQDGDAVERIDQLAEHFGMPLGPLALGDEVGLDVGYKVSMILEEGYGERMKVASVFHDIYKDKSLRGKKSGEGFYTHKGKEKAVNFKVGGLIKPHHSHNPNFNKDDTLDRLLLIMVNEAARCIEEKVVESPELCDMAMIMGTGFPPFRGGLCRYADQIGIKTCVDRLNELATIYGDRFLPADLLTRMAEENKQFYQ